MRKLAATGKRTVIDAMEAKVEDNRQARASRTAVRGTPREGTKALGAATSGAGAALLATAASACCVGPALAPVVVAVLGASGAAWAAGLKPYSPYLLAAALGSLLYGFRVAYRRPTGCPDGACARSRPPAARLVLWVAAAVWFGAALVNSVWR